jgi:flavorubredoxin
MPTTYRPAPDIDVITSAVAIGDAGCLPVNAFVLHGPEPMLVDAGIVAERDAFLDALGTVIDPAELRWLWLTHTDPDHTGAIEALMADNPHLRLITSFLGCGIMGLSRPVPLDRVYIINPGEETTFGHRRVTAVRPPAFDNPITTGFLDHTSGTLFSSDCFGAVLAQTPTDVRDVEADALREAQVAWACIDSPWLQKIDRELLAADLEAVRRLQPTMVLSSHLPAAPGSTLNQLLGALGAVSDAAPYIGPTHAQLETMLAAPAPA